MMAHTFQIKKLDKMVSLFPHETTFQEAIDSISIDYIQTVSSYRNLHANPIAEKVRKAETDHFHLIIMDLIQTVKNTHKSYRRLVPNPLNNMKE
jgi:hypothetical protein